MARATGMTRERISRGIAELENPGASEEGARRIRRIGAGRKRAVEKDPGLLPALEALIEPTSRGDPQSPLRWTCKSTRRLAKELTEQQHPVSPSTVRMLLKNELGHSLQSTRKTAEGSSHPDRNAQFEHINDTVAEFMAAGEPAISVDCKKKELVGNFANSGREYRPKGEPEKVAVHDFPDPKLGKVAPYGIYDLADNVGWVNVGVSHETSAFTVESIRRWWNDLGSYAYPGITRLLISADSGGSNGVRRRQWKYELQAFADETGLEITGCHLPPGTSKWNKIEHRLFCHITRNWRGRPLTDYQVIVELIGSTRTERGLEVRAELDFTEHPKGIRISDAEMATINLHRSDFHRDWNYTIKPRPEMRCFF